MDVIEHMKQRLASVRQEREGLMYQLNAVNGYIQACEEFIAVSEGRLIPAPTPVEQEAKQQA